MKRILICFIVLIFTIGFVSASENITEIETSDNPTEPLSENYGEYTNLNLNHECNSNLTDVNKYSDIYVDNTVEVSGDGLSPENPIKNFNYDIFNKLSSNGIVHLANGEYEIPNNDEEYTIVGNGQNTVITKCWFETSSYVNSNKSLTLINLTFKIPSNNFVGYLSGDDINGFTDTSIYYDISLDGKNFNFINCTFMNASFVSGQWQYNNPNRDKLTDISSTIFENCKFINYSYDKNIKESDITTYGGTKIHNIEFESKNLITAYAYSKYTFNFCKFENLTVDFIIDSYGGQTDHYGRYDGVYIHNSNFKSCSLISIVKARQLSYCEIVDCTYDFDASETADLVSPFYVNKTIKATDLNETNLTVSAKDNSIIITLTDVNANKPVAGVEVAIINNNKVFDYRDTDSNGQIVLDNLFGTYNFEFSYLGDEYVGYAPTSLNKTFTFVKNETPKENTSSKTDSNTKTTTAKKVTKTASKITAKKATFKKSKKVKKYTITLKSGKTPIKKVKVYLKVKSKTYKATTNAKGKATFKITKLTKKGTFTAKITFKGNSLYKAVSKSVKIKVK